jgi:hypothetical protein
MHLCMEYNQKTKSIRRNFLVTCCLFSMNDPSCIYVCSWCFFIIEYTYQSPLTYTLYIEQLKCHIYLFIFCRAAQNFSHFWQFYNLKFQASLDRRATANAWFGSQTSMVKRNWERREGIRIIEIYDPHIRFVFFVWRWIGSEPKW